MPGDFTTASSKAKAEAAKNGYSAATGATVTPAIEPRVEPPAGRVGHDRRPDLLPAGHRDEQGPDHPHRDRRVHPARPDGQPAQHVRRQQRLLLGGGRGGGYEPLRRRRLRHVLQPEPDRRTTSSTRTATSTRSTSRPGPGPRTSTSTTRRSAPSTTRREPATTGSTGTSPAGRRCRPTTPCGRTPPRRRSTTTDDVGRRLDRDAVREQAPGRQERGAARGLGDLADPCLLEPARLHERPVPQPAGGRSPRSPRRGRTASR